VRVLRVAVLLANTTLLGGLGLMLAIHGLPKASEGAFWFVLAALLAPCTSLAHWYWTRDPEEHALQAAVRKAELRKRLRELASDTQGSDDASAAPRGMGGSA
jgi:hypothetical protein